MIVNQKTQGQRERERVNGDSQLFDYQIRREVDPKTQLNCDGKPHSLGKTVCLRERERERPEREREAEIRDYDSYVVAYNRPNFSQGDRDRHPLLQALLCTGSIHFETHVYAELSGFSFMTHNTIHADLNGLKVNGYGWVLRVRLKIATFAFSSRTNTTVQKN